MRIHGLCLCLIFSLTLSLCLVAEATQPDPEKTPGFLCSPQDPNFSGFTYPSHVARCKRNVSLQEKKKVAMEYGNIPESDWPNYEFDHLFPLCTGGSDDIRNIWPQPLGEAHEKDVLENQVCLELRTGTTTQTEAIEKIRDWIVFHYFLE